jgi:hypothetical protein
MGLEQHFFEIDGLVISEGAALYSGSENPSSIDLPIGSLYMRTTGEIWYRNSLSIWQLLNSGGNVITEEELIDYNENGEPDIMFDDDAETYMREEL